MEFSVIHLKNQRVKIWSIGSWTWSTSGNQRHPLNLKKKITRLDSVESIPLILHEFLEDLKDTNRVGSVESLWSRGEEVEIRMIQGTPLSPPKTNANVIILEMTNEDEVNIKMYCTLLLSITWNHYLLHFWLRSCIISFHME